MPALTLDTVGPSITNAACCGFWEEEENVKCFVMTLLMMLKPSSCEMMTSFSHKEKKEGTRIKRRTTYGPYSTIQPNPLPLLLLLLHRLALPLHRRNHTLSLLDECLNDRKAPSARLPVCCSFLFVYLFRKRRRRRTGHWGAERRTFCWFSHHILSRKHNSLFLFFRIVGDARRLHLAAFPLILVCSFIVFSKGRPTDWRLGT